MKVKAIKKEGYTIISNYHFKDRGLSLKAKGLLSLMLSLPYSWDYSLLGLAGICIESKEAIRKALNELKENKYLKVIESRNGNGRFDYNYIICEKTYED